MVENGVEASDIIWSFVFRTDPNSIIIKQMCGWLRKEQEQVFHEGESEFRAEK